MIRWVRTCTRYNSTFGINAKDYHHFIVPALGSSCIRSTTWFMGFFFPKLVFFSLCIHLKYFFLHLYFSVRNTYKRWQNRHILGHQEITDIPTTTWPPTSFTTQGPKSNVLPANGEAPGGGGGGPPMSHDEVDAQDMKSSNDIRVFDEHKHHGEYKAKK